jgi:hypothetical protein
MADLQMSEVEITLSPLNSSLEMRRIKIPYKNMKFLYKYFLLQSVK